MKFLSAFLYPTSSSNDAREIERVLEGLPPLEDEDKVRISWMAVQAPPMPGLLKVNDGAQAMPTTVAKQTPAMEPSATPAVNPQKIAVELAPASPAQTPLINKISTDNVTKVIDSAPIQMQEAQVSSDSTAALDELLQTTPKVIPEPSPEPIGQETRSSMLASRSSPLPLERPPVMPLGTVAVSRTVVPPMTTQAVPVAAASNIPMRMTQEDVIAAYKIFLNRLPESSDVIRSRVNSSLEANLIDFALSAEFVRRADLSSIVFPLAKAILEKRQKRS